MSDTNKELLALLVEARDQLPLAASCWNEDEDRELAERNVQHVLGLINRINAALTPHPETPAPLRVERTPRDYAIEHAEYMAKDAERLIDAVNDLALAEQEREDGTANPSDVDAACEAVSEAQRALRSGVYEFRKRRDRALAVPMPQSAGVTDEQIVATAREKQKRLAHWDYDDLVSFARSVLALAPGLSGWQPIETAPKNRKVIVGYFNQLGNHRTVMASYYLAETLESEHTDSGWADEGWYEECESQSETIMPTDCDPTHWMPLPTAPGLAPHQPQPEGRYNRAREMADRVMACLESIADGWDESDIDEVQSKLLPNVYDCLNLLAMAAQPQPEPQEAAEQAIIARFLEQSGQYVTNDASRVAAVLSAFDEAVADELAKVSTVPYNSHEICKWFASNVRESLSLYRDASGKVHLFSAPQEASKPKPCATIADCTTPKLCISVGTCKGYYVMPASVRESASKEASKAVPVADERQPSDGDYLRWAEQAGAKVNWDFESASSARVVFLTASQWGRFCDKVRALYLRPSQQALSDAKDAARYRHLKGCNSSSLMVMQCVGTAPDDYIVLTGGHADEAIDAAILAAAGGSQ